MGYQVTYRKHDEVDWYRYESNHRICQEVKPFKRRVDKEHGIHFVCRFPGGQCVENEVAVTANRRHYKNGNNHIGEVSFYIDFYVSEDRQ